MKIATTNNTHCIFGISCMVCGETVGLSALEDELVRRNKRIDPKICDKCKAAILAMRKQIEKKEGV